MFVIALFPNPTTAIQINRKSTRQHERPSLRTQYRMGKKIFRDKNKNHGDGKGTSGPVRRKCLGTAVRRLVAWATPILVLVSSILVRSGLLLFAYELLPHHLSSSTPSLRQALVHTSNCFAAALSPLSILPSVFCVCTFTQYNTLEVYAIGTAIADRGRPLHSCQHSTHI